MPLFIPGGTYTITTANITGDVEVYGSRLAPRILGLDQSPQINIAPTPPNNYINCVRIAGITIDGQNQAFPGSPSDAGMIQASNVGNLYIEECFVNQSALHGIYVPNSSGWISSNTVGAASRVGIYCLDSKFVIEANSVIGSGNGGIQVYRSSSGSDNSIVTGNTVGQTGATLGGTGQYGNGIGVFQADYVVVSNNTIYGSTFAAIRFNSSNHGHVLGNSCYGSGEMGIWMESPGASFFGGIVADNIIENAGGGINIANYPGRFVTVANNQVTNIVVQTVIPGYESAGRGIAAQTGDVLLTGNQIENVADWGITLIPFSNGGATTTGQAESNMMRNCTGGIGFVQSNENTALMVGGNTINNYTSSSQYGAIVACSYDGTTGSVTRLPGATDLGNATSSGFDNVVLLLNYSYN